MPKRGPPVFLDYDQAELDAAYDQAAYAPNRDQLIKRRISDSEGARHRIGEPGRAAYGAAEIEQLDIYRTGRAAAPVFIFIHGGAWRSGRSRDFATPAEMFTAAGAHYVVPDFALGAGRRRQPHRARRSGLPRRRVGVQKCRAFRW
jgi:arylformamidase